MTAEWIYKSKKINLNSLDGKFSCQELAISDKPSLEAVKREIDTILKSQFKKGVTALRSGGYSEDCRFDEVTITSVDKDGHFWYKAGGDGRGKEYTLYKNNEHNQKLVEQMKGLTEQIDNLKEERDKLRGKMQEIKADELKEVDENAKSSK